MRRTQHTAILYLLVGLALVASTMLPNAALASDDTNDFGPGIPAAEMGDAEGGNGSAATEGGGLSSGVEAPDAGEETAASDAESDAIVEVAEQGESQADADLEVAADATLNTQATATDGTAQQLAVSYRTYVQRAGWKAWVSQGKTSGTLGKFKRIEGICIRLNDADGKEVPGVKYQVHAQGAGWQSWASDGQTCGPAGEGKRIEAIRIRLDETLAASYDVWYHVHAQSYGWLDWASNGATAGTTSLGKRVEAIEVMLVGKGSTPPGPTQRPYVDGTHLALRGHIQRVGWVDSDNAVGTVGRGLRIEAFSAKLRSGDHPGGVVYSAHVQKVGWQKNRRDGRMAGTSGRKLRLEAVTLRLTGEAASYYDVWYRAHVQSLGWLGWTKNGAQSGTEGLSLRVERIETAVVPKGENPPEVTDQSLASAFVRAPQFSFAAKGVGTSWRPSVGSGRVIGVADNAYRVELFRASIDERDASLGGDIAYSVHAIGGDWVGGSNGSEAGAGGRAIDMVRISLDGDITKLYTVYYRAHVSGIGWLQWTTGGEKAGSEGMNKAIDALQVRMVKKGEKLPSNAKAVRNTALLTKTIEEQQGQALAQANARQRRIVDAALSTPSPGTGLCADWVERVYDNAGYGMHYGNADDLYYAYCHSNDFHNLKVGMIIAVSTHNHSYLGGIYGHVCIYVGDGWVMDNVGSIRKVSLQSWLDYYGTTVTPKWGWLGNVDVA